MLKLVVAVESGPVVLQDGVVTDPSQQLGLHQSFALVRKMRLRVMATTSAAFPAMAWLTLLVHMLPVVDAQFCNVRGLFQNRIRCGWNSLK